MKLLAIVAMFAFVAVQLSCSAPVPDEEKKEVEVVPAAVAVEASSHVVPETKAEQSEVARLAEPAAPSPHAEEKKV
ncbi:uncharacterized protein LOC126776453 [Nymphalis io]|uniref:uncharacterized protein LOC126776453 n=1 Tax=Inachis io TaxID=171585 RepID=UPI002167B3D2|nr:uncharacterized protein LOC126776453 [Nymphalis io]